MARKYQFGGGDFFNAVADQALQQVDQQWAEFQQSEAPEAEAAPEEDPYADYDPAYEELSEKYSELESRFNELSQRQTMNFTQSDSFGDGFMDFLFSSDKNGPIDFDNLELDDEGLPAYGTGTPAPQGTSGEPRVQHSLQMEISKREGNYSSVSPNSSGTGKYQFIWSIHGPNIQRVTGVRSREEFLRSPRAQEAFFQHWDQTTLTPEADRLLPQLRRYYPSITEEQAKMMIHFGGAGNVQKAIKSGDFRSPLDANGTSLHGYVFRQMGGLVNDKYTTFLKTLPPNLRTTDTTIYNMRGYWDALGQPAKFDYSQPKEADGSYHAFSRHPRTGEILKKPNHPTFRFALEEDARAGYLPYRAPDGRIFTFGKGDKIPTGYTPYKHQYGGVAHTPEEQYVGLNNPAYDELFFPLEGANTFRGLDSGEPVYIKDQSGQEVILYGPHDTARLQGPVYEKRIAKKYTLQK